MVKMYPEQNAECPMAKQGHGIIYAYCNRHGLFAVRVQMAVNMRLIFLKKIRTLTHIVNNQNILSSINYWNILSMVVE